MSTIAGVKAAEQASSRYFFPAAMHASLERQISPLELDPATEEPFLRLPAPYEHIIITPPRVSDAQSIADIHNDPRVYRWTHGPPYPYTLEDGIFWLGMGKASTDAVYRQLEDAAAADPACANPLAFTSECPVRSIREKRPDGTELYLGEIAFQPTTFEWELDEEVRARLAAENAAHPRGSPDIIWSIGDYLKPSHHGQGIMTAVIKAIIHQWVIPRMNARYIQPTTFTDNEGSTRTFLKNGFIICKTVSNVLRYPGKGDYPEEWKGIHVLEYRATND